LPGLAVQDQDVVLEAVEVAAVEHQLGTALLAALALGWRPRSCACRSPRRAADRLQGLGAAAAAAEARPRRTSKGRGSLRMKVPLWNPQRVPSERPLPEFRHELSHDRRQKKRGSGTQAHSPFFYGSRPVARSAPAAARGTAGRRPSRPAARRGARRAEPTGPPSESGFRKQGVVWLPSQTSPTPLPFLSTWRELVVVGQLSHAVDDAVGVEVLAGVAHAVAVAVGLIGVVDRRAVVLGVDAAVARVDATRKVSSLPAHGRVHCFLASALSGWRAGAALCRSCRRPSGWGRWRCG
jgi:hypothetical protein